jgi:hypothetical protein
MGESIEIYRTGYHKKAAFLGGFLMVKTNYGYSYWLKFFNFFFFLPLIGKEKPKICRNRVFDAINIKQMTRGTKWKRYILRLRIAMASIN